MAILELQLVTCILLFVLWLCCLAAGLQDPHEWGGMQGRDVTREMKLDLALVFICVLSLIF